jgi:hypothetical protein
MLGLAFLILIGFTLIAEAAHLGHFIEGRSPEGLPVFCNFLLPFCGNAQYPHEESEPATPIQLHGYAETAKEQGLLTKRSPKAKDHFRTPVNQHSPP